MMFLILVLFICVTVGFVTANVDSVWVIVILSQTVHHVDHLIFNIQKFNLKPLCVDFYADIVYFK